MATPIMHCPICNKFVEHRITNDDQSDDESIDTMIECNICKFFYSTHHQQEYIELFQIVEEIWPLGREEYHLGFEDFHNIYQHCRGQHTPMYLSHHVCMKFHTYSLRQMIVFIALYFKNRSKLNWKRFRIKQENQKKKFMCCIEDFPLDVCGRIASFLVEPVP